MTRIKFIIDKKIDIDNHLIALDAYRRHLKSGFKQRDKINDALLRLSIQKRKKEIEKSISGLYKKRKYLDVLARDINKVWIEIEPEFIRRLEKIHKHPFPFRSVRGVLSSAQGFGYKVDKGWFATSMFKNKFGATDTAMHELMHFMFHKYYQNSPAEKGLPQNKFWDVKESFTVLLNLEFEDLRFNMDYGYPQHKKLREAITKSWKKHHDFDKALDAAVRAAKRS